MRAIYFKRRYQIPTQKHIKLCIYNIQQSPADMHSFNIDKHANITYIQQIFNINSLAKVYSLFVQLSNTDLLQIQVVFNHNITFLQLKQAGLFKHKHIQIPDTNVVVFIPK